MNTKRGMTGSVLFLIWTVMLLMLWGFAFYPSSKFSSELILRAQVACFGTMANGLPAPHGWLILVLSPLAILSALWASHAGELYAAPAFIKDSKSSKAIALLLIPILMLVAHWVGKRITYAYRLQSVSFDKPLDNPLPEDYLKMNKHIPSFELIDQFGARINQDVFKGKTTILTFAFAHCSTVCPVLIKDTLSAQKIVGSSKVQAIIVSIDPWRDTPHSLPSLAKTWSIGDNSRLISGDPDSVQKFLDEMQIVTARSLKDGNINHAPQAMVVNSEGKVIYSFLNPTVDWLVSAAKRVLN